MIVNGAQYGQMDVSPIADSDRIFLPARFVVVFWRMNWDPALGK